jgi:signal recognition particle receptor subunit alpha
MLSVHQVGAALSMTYVTGQPILFVGCGQVLRFLLALMAPLTIIEYCPSSLQTYTDLRQLRVPHIVQALMSD